MWSGVVAGLALLTLSFARLAQARNTSVDDQQLTYQGQGWQTESAPQACTGISQTVHSTSDSGDTVLYSFTGDAVYVHGPATYGAGSIPITIVLDGAVQPPSPITQDASGCSILYANPNIPDDGGQHNLMMVFTHPSGSSTFSLSGITENNPDAAPPVAPAVTTSSSSAPTNTAPRLQANPDVPLPTVSAVPAPASPSPEQGPIFSSVNPNGDRTGPTAGIAFTSTSSGGSASNTSTGTGDISTFVTTPGMTAGVVGAIVGTIVGMVALLVVFVLIRRRITRQTARKLDQHNSFGRGRDMEEGKGKGKAISLEDDGQPPVWGANGKSDVSFIMAHAGLSSPAPASLKEAPRPNSRSTISPISPARSLVFSHGRSPSTTYAVNLPSTLGPRSSDARPTPTIVIPQGHNDLPSSPLRGLETSSSSQLPPFSSAAATWGDEKQVQGAYVVNRTESTGTGSVRTGSFGSSRMGHPPPGYI